MYQQHAFYYFPVGEINEFAGTTLWGCELEANFHRVLELCDEPSKLGTKLLKEAIRIGAIDTDSNKEGTVQ